MVNPAGREVQITDTAITAALRSIRPPAGPNHDMTYITLTTLERAAAAEAEASPPNLKDRVKEHGK